MGLLRRFRSSLTYPVAGTLVLVTVLPVAAVGLLLASSIRDHLTTVEKQYLTRQAVGLASEVSLFFSSHRTQLEATARALDVGSRPSVSETDALLKGIAKRDPLLMRLQLVNSNGEGSFVSTQELEPKAAEALAGLISDASQRAATGKEVSDLHELLPGHPAGVSIFAYPVRGNGNRVQAVLTGVLDLQPLQSRLSDNALSGLIVTVIDDKGTAVLSSRTELENTSLAGSPLVRDYLRRPLRLTKVYSQPQLRLGSDVLGSIAPAQWPRWAVVVERPTAEAFASVRAMQKRTLISTVVAAAAALAIGLGLSGYLIRPLQKLTDVTSALAEGNLTERAQVPGHNEIAQLAANFNHMAGSLETLVRRLKHALRQNQELFLETIRTLATAIDAKDPYTRGHSERVSSYSMAIARALGLDSDQVFRVRIAAILHDVGKLGIRDNILNKPGGLTDAEYTVMRRHPEIGSQIMAPIRMLKDIIPGIRNHHETWDGTGYPDKLKGEEIPLVARIIGVADTFDAMTTARPYQKPLELEFVLAKMRAMAGSRFDPQVVQAFLAAVEAGDITPPDASTDAVSEEGVS
ncbi:MAG: HD domain-containing protein [Acidobacteria bacterium]|nr:HD domain-containing protein [Acidobacteriota bacterium]